jgi:hypothetical protein
MGSPDKSIFGGVLCRVTCADAISRGGGGSILALLSSLETQLLS